MFFLKHLADKFNRGHSLQSEVSETSLPAQAASAVAPQLIPCRAIQRFESKTYGEGYIDLHVDDEIVPLPTPPGEEDARWMYGRNGIHIGWFPAAFVQESPESFR